MSTKIYNGSNTFANLVQLLCCCCFGRICNLLSEQEMHFEQFCRQWTTNTPTTLRTHVPGIRKWSNATHLRLDPSLACEFILHLLLNLDRHWLLYQNLQRSSSRALITRNLFRILYATIKNFNFPLCTNEVVCLTMGNTTIQPLFHNGKIRTKHWNIGPTIPF
jgi:hypothetical protein